MTYSKYFLATVMTTFMTTHGASAASTAGGASVSAKEETAAASRPVAVIGGFAEADIKAYFSQPAERPKLESAWLGLSSAAVPPRDMDVVFKAMIASDTLKFLNPEAYPVDNFEALLGQLYRQQPYIDALTNEYLKLRPKTGMAVRPVLVTASDLPEGDHDKLGRKQVQMVKSEMQQEIDAVEAKLAAQVEKGKVAERKAAEERAAAVKAISAMRTELEEQIAELQVRIKDSMALEGALKEDVEALTRGLMEHKAVLAAKEAQITALENEVKERDTAIAKMAKGSSGSAAPLSPEGEKFEKDVHAQVGLLVGANLTLKKYAFELEAVLSSMGVALPGTRPDKVLDTRM